MAGVKDVVKKDFPQSLFQRCIFHKKGNVLRDTRSSHKYEMAQDLKRVFILENPDYTVKKAKRKLTAFLSKWSKRYPHLHRKFEENDIEYYFSYLTFTAKIRLIIYTTNWVERLNKKIKERR